ncbi:MAG: TerL protein [Desulfobulbaceae bacterium]|nr:TerL protein [Desulfobulbaceae bacterium]
MSLPFTFDFRNPDYTAVIQWRISRLLEIRKNPAMIPALKVYYKDHIADFIDDWGCTFDPRNVSLGLPTVMPFVLFPKQRELVDWIIERWMAQEPGLIEKSRDTGVSWIAVATGASLSLFHSGFVGGYGSRKEEYVDKIGSPKSLFWKAREFIRLLPPEFREGWSAAKNSAHMRITFPKTGSFMAGEAGDNIGRGDRSSIYFVDESAHLDHPDLIDAALSATTNCRIDLSSVNGMANSFAEKRHGGKIKVFVFDWRDDPRKDQEWYDKQIELFSVKVVAQEIDRNYHSSGENTVIPSAWVQAAINAHVKLGIEPKGAKTAGMDVADEGADKNALAGRHGILLEQLDEWSGKDSDIYQTTVKMFHLMDDWGYTDVMFDNDGLGSGVRGDARVINEKRRLSDVRQINVTPYRGSGVVADPAKEVTKGSGRTNKDFFDNYKAQSWWRLRLRFLATFQAVNKTGKNVNLDDIVSIDPNLPYLARLTMELSQVTYSLNNNGQIVVDKAPKGTKSPNLADAVNIAYSTGKRVMVVNDDAAEILTSL